MTNARDRYLTIFPAVFWHLDGRAGRMRVENPDHARSIGFDVAAFEDAERAQAVYPPDLNDVVEAWRVAQLYRTPFNACFRMRMLNGDYRWVRAQAVVDEQGAANPDWYGSTVDIHDQRAGELERAIAHERTRGALAGVLSLAWEMDCTTGTFWFSDRVPADLGILVENDGQTWSRRPVIHPDDAEAARAAYVAHLKGETSALEVDYRARSRDGGWLWVNDRGRVIQRSPDGLALKMVGVTTDISERKRERDRYELAQEAGQIGCFESDLTTGTAVGTPLFFELLGYPPTKGSLQHEEWRQRIHPDDLAEATQRLTEIMAAKPEGTNVAEYRVVLPDGSVRWLNSRTKIEHHVDGRTTRFGALQDVTQRKEAELALAEQAAILTTIFNQATVGIIHRVYEGPVIAVNDRFCEIVGRSREELATLSWQEMTHPDDLSADGRRDIGAPVPSDRFAVEKRFLRPDGTAVWCRTLVTVLRDASGTVSSSIAIIEDITAAKALETERLTLQSQLDRATRLLTAGAMGATLSHELQQPHTAAVNYLSAAKALLRREGRPADIEKAVDEALQEVLRAGKIVRNVRNFVALGRPATAPTDLRTVLAEAVRHLKTETNDIVVVEEVDDEPLVVAADAVQIVQVATNLLRNARDALASTADPRIIISAYRRDGGIEARVRDNGPGIPSDVMARLFEPFVTSKPKGLGLGLSVCRVVLEAHGGSLRYESTPGRTEAILTLPALAG